MTGTLIRTFVLFVPRTPCTTYSKKSPYSVLNVVPLKYGILRTPYPSIPFLNKRLVLRTKSRTLEVWNLLYSVPLVPRTRKTHRTPY